MFHVPAARTRLHYGVAHGWRENRDEDDDVADDGNLLWLIALKPHGQALKRDTFLRHFRVTPTGNCQLPTAKQRWQPE